MTVLRLSLTDRFGVAAAIIVGNVFADIDHLGPALIAIRSVMVMMVVAVVWLPVAVRSVRMTRLRSGAVRMGAPTAMLVVTKVVLAVSLRITNSMRLRLHQRGRARPTHRQEVQPRQKFLKCSLIFSFSSADGSSSASRAVVNATDMPSGAEG